ncbi:hypothetical protein HPP92_006265 [Vanilla planifolia]|uniref:Uncharacterized protein n=1 Tax=Vanilla planifolia TaxID=51239 RepID=A0A835RV93_VANPL|nr:hypothetical protein HPP92_006265 [Vanilla planifolia]
MTLRMGSGVLGWELFLMNGASLAKKDGRGAIDVPPEKLVDELGYSKTLQEKRATSHAYENPNQMKVLARMKGKGSENFISKGIVVWYYWKVDGKWKEIEAPTPLHL